MVHFTLTSPFRTQRMYKYASFAVLDVQANCTHLQNSFPNMKEMNV